MTILPLQVETFGWLLTVGFTILIFFVLVVTFIRRYKRCPSDRILVVYGKVGDGNLPNVFTVEQPLLCL